ncbi:MAG: insulinase family protein [Deltaproteobacteria bacterium]|nr:insulinase family protein [Deltaproteobacteria bacterium]
MMRATVVFASLLIAAPAIAQPTAGAVRPPPPAGFAGSAIADWTTPPVPTAEKAFRPPVGKRQRLANGMQLIVVENHALPIASMVLVAPGAGAAADPAGKGGLAAYTADLLDEGAGGRSAIAIADETDRLGADIAIGTDADASYVSVRTLAKTLAPTLALVTAVVTQPSFDESEAGRVKSDWLTSLALRRDRPREVAALVLEAAIYGGTTPYGHPADGTPAEFASVTTADARGFYAAHWNPAVMTLIVVGDVDPKALRAALDRGLGAWKPRGAVAPAKIAVAAVTPASRLLLVDRPGATQSDVRIGLVGPDRMDRRFFAFEVYRTTLGGGFTSRLTQRLREQLGIVYHTYANQDWRVARGPLVIDAALATPATGQGLRETIKMVDDLTTTDVPAAELDKVKQNLIRSLPKHFATNAATAGTLAELVLHGLPLDWYARYAAGVRKVTARDVKAAAHALVPGRDLVFAVVGDLKVIRADLDALGLGAPAMFDPEGAPLAK